MNPLQMILLDDDPLIRKHYEKVINEFLDEVKINIYGTAAELLKDRQVVAEAQLALLDVCIDDMDGIHVAEMIRKENKFIKIIFISNSADYVFDSFKVQPLNYILKDRVSDGELILAIRDAFDHFEDTNVEESFVCLNKDRVVVLRLTDIIAFEMINRQIIVHTVHGDYTSRCSLQDLYDKYYKRGFEKANRSCIVNMNHILRIEGADIFMSRKFKIPITYRNKNQFKDIFRQYLLNNKLYDKMHGE